MDRNKFVWNTSFPSLTVCPHKRLDDTKVDNYIRYGNIISYHLFSNIMLQVSVHLRICRSRSKEFRTKADIEQFKNFLEKLSNVSYENFSELPMHRTYGIPSHQYLELLWNLSFVFKPEMNSGTANKLYMQDTITELGICYSVNSKLSVYNSYRYCMLCKALQVPCGYHELWWLTLLN